jgi:hypothetical protein
VTEQAAVLALAKRATSDWHLVAQLVESAGSALRVLRQDWTGFEPPELLAAVSADLQTTPSSPSSRR